MRWRSTGVCASRRDPRSRGSGREFRTEVSLNGSPQTGWRSEDLWTEAQRGSRACSTALAGHGGLPGTAGRVCLRSTRQNSVEMMGLEPLPEHRRRRPIAPANRCSCACRDTGTQKGRRAPPRALQIIQRWHLQAHGALPSTNDKVSTHTRNRCGPVFEPSDVGDQTISNGQDLPALRRPSRFRRRMLIDHAETNEDLAAEHARFGDDRSDPVRSTTAVPGKYLFTVATPGVHIVRRPPGDVGIEKVPIAEEIGWLERSANLSGDLHHPRWVKCHCGYLHQPLHAILTPAGGLRYFTHPAGWARQYQK